jgi:hypothetical protein
MAVHPILGDDREPSEAPRRCSRCQLRIPDERVPLILWSESGELAWVYCATCEPLMLATLMRKRRPGRPAPGDRPVRVKSNARTALERLADAFSPWISDSETAIATLKAFPEIVSYHRGRLAAFTYARDLAKIRAEREFL